MEKTFLDYSHLPSYLALWLTLSGSNYPCLEQISTVPKMFEPLKFDCIVGIFISISREIFMLSWVKHEKSFITSGQILTDYTPEKQFAHGESDYMQMQT